jgi:hypothetical protein
MQINITDGCLKCRIGNYVVYDIDYLLEHQNVELELLRRLKESRKTAKPVKWELVLEEVKAICEGGAK